MSRDRICARCHRQRALAQIMFDIPTAATICRDTLDCLEHMSDRDLMRLWKATATPNSDIETRLHRLITRLRDEKMRA